MKSEALCFQPSSGWRVLISKPTFVFLPRLYKYEYSESHLLWRHPGIYAASTNATGHMMQQVLLGASFNAQRLTASSRALDQHDNQV